MVSKPKKKLSLPLIMAMAAVLTVLVVYFFGNFRQERVVKRFIAELQRGNYQQAYQIWGPTNEYPFPNFMTDWGGPSSYYGRIQGYKILASKTRGNGVIVAVEFDHLKYPVYFWVDLKNNTLSYSPFALKR